MEGPAEFVEAPRRLVGSKGDFHGSTGGERLGIGDEVLEARPSVIHFGGYEVGKVHKMRFKVTNVSLDKLRIQVFPTQTEAFSCFHEKKGLLHPGMSETVQVRFEPKEWKYYQDAIRIKAGPHGIEVPLHGYPVVSAIDVPQMIDFGVCQLNKTKTKTLELTCSVPVDFDFEIVEVSSQPEFSVEPKHGKIPADGSAEVKVSFTPHQLVVASFSFRLSISQFNFNPVVCTVCGSAYPGIAREREIETSRRKFHGVVLAERKKDLQPKLLKTIEQVPFDRFGRIELGEKRYGIGSGAVHDPAAERKPNQEGEKGVIKNNDDGEDEMIQIDGIRIPCRLDGVCASNYILTQEPNKMKPKELRKAIEEHRSSIEKKRTEADLLESKFLVEDLDQVEIILRNDMKDADTSTSRQLKELVFQQEMKRIKDGDRNREFKSTALKIGSEKLNTEEIQKIQNARDVAIAQRKAFERAQEREREENICLKSVTVRKIENRVDFFPKPTFDEIENDVWRFRQRLLQKFVAIAGKVVVRRRCEVRMRKIWASLGTRRTREEVGRFVEEDNERAKIAWEDPDFEKKRDMDMEEPEWKAYPRKLSHLEQAKSTQWIAANGDDDVEGLPKVRPPSKKLIAEVCKIDSKRLFPASFPIYVDSAVSEKKIIPTNPTQGFQEAKLFKLRQPQESNIHGYKQLTYPAVPAYMPRLDHLEMKDGAEHESHFSHLPRLFDEETSQALKKTFPEECLVPSKLPRLDFVLPSRTIRTFLQFPNHVEAEMQYVLQARTIETNLRDTKDKEEAWAPGYSLARSLSKEPNFEERFQGWWEQEAKKYESFSLLHGPLEQDCLGDEDEDAEVKESRLEFLGLEEATVPLFPFADKVLNQKQHDASIQKQREKKFKINR